MIETEKEAALLPVRSNVELCPQRISWEQRYSDDSGVQYAVRYDEVDKHYDGCAKIQIVAVDSAEFPVTQLDWLIACLCKIRDELGHNVVRVERHPRSAG